jgi:hypothetical protein
VRARASFVTRLTSACSERTRDNSAPGPCHFNHRLSTASQVERRLPVAHGERLSLGLLEPLLPTEKEVRLLGISLSSLAHAQVTERHQLSLLPDNHRIKATALLCLRSSVPDSRNCTLLGKDAGRLSASTIGRLKDTWPEEHARCRSVIDARDC